MDITDVFLLRPVAIIAALSPPENGHSPSLSLAIAVPFINALAMLIDRDSACERER
jgi:hypothetical protein